jgi:hypothetical protein
MTTTKRMYTWAPFVDDPQLADLIYTPRKMVVQRYVDELGVVDYSICERLNNRGTKVWTSHTETIESDMWPKQHLYNMAAMLRSFGAEVEIIDRDEREEESQ